MRLKAGTLYKIKKKDFPNFSGSTSFYFEDSEPIHFHENSIIFVLNPLFVIRTKLSTGPGRKMERYLYWCVKVMINDKIGYIYMWEDEWEEII